jgi:hypothetical protein
MGKDLYSIKYFSDKPVKIGYTYENAIDSSDDDASKIHPLAHLPECKRIVPTNPHSLVDLGSDALHQIRFRAGFYIDICTSPQIALILSFILARASTN